MSANDYLGSQAEENAKYLDSIEGKTAQLKNRLQELAAITIDSEWLKDLISLGTKAISMVTKFGKSFGVLRTAIAGISAVLLQKSGLSMFFNKSQSGKWEFANFGKGLVSAVKNAFSTLSWKDTYKSIFGNQELSKNLAGYLDLKQLQPEDITPEFQEWYMGFDETTRKALTLNDAMKKFGESTINAAGIFSRFKSIGINALSTLGTMLVSMAASWAIGKVFSQLEYRLNRKQHKLEEGSEAQERINQTRDNFSTKEKYIDENTERFAKLRQGVSETGKNISLSNDEYAEYLSINQQLAEYLPTLVSGFDAQGNALLRLSGNADQTTQSIKDLLEQERQIQAADVMKDLPATMDQAFITMRDAHDSLEAQESAYEVYAGINNWISGGNNEVRGFDFENGRIQFQWDANDEIQDSIQSRIQGAVQQIQLNYSDGILDTSESDIFNGKFVANWKADPKKISEMENAFRQYLGDDFQYIETQMASQNQEILSNKAILDSTWQQQAQNLLTGLQLYGDYNQLANTELGTKVQDLISSQISNFDIFGLDDNQFKVYDSNEIGYMYNNIVDPLIDIMNDPDKKVQLGDLLDFDFSKLTNEEQRDQIDQLTKSLFDGDEQKAYELQVGIGFMYKDENGKYHEFQTDRRDSIFEQLGGVIGVDQDGNKIRSATTNDEVISEAKKQVKELSDRYNNAVANGNTAVAQSFKRQLELARTAAYSAGGISWDDITKLTQEQQDTILQARGEGELPKSFKTFESLIEWIDKYNAKKAELQQSGTLADIFNMEDFDVSPFEDKLSAIDTALSSLRENGELTADEQLTLQKQIPDLTDFSLESISDKGLDVLGDYIDKMREYAEAADLGEEGTKQFEKYLSNLAAQQAMFTPSMEAAQEQMRNSIITATPGNADYAYQSGQYYSYLNALKDEYGEDLDMNVVAYMSMEDMFSGSADEVLQKYEDAKVYVDLELGENNLDKAIREQQRTRTSSLLSLEEQTRQNKTANNITLTPEDYDASIFLQRQAVNQARNERDKAKENSDTILARYNSSEGIAKQKYQEKWLSAESDRIQKEQDLIQQETELTNLENEQANQEINPQLESLSRLTEEYNQLDEAMKQLENHGQIIPSDMSNRAGELQEEIAGLNQEIGEFKYDRYRQTGNEEDYSSANSYFAQANTATQTAATDKARTFESTMTQYSNQLTDLQNSASAIQEDITLREGRGLIPTLNQYAKLLNNGEAQIQNLKDQNFELRKQQRSVKDNQAEYRKYGEQIRANNAAISSMQGNMQGWSDAIKSYAETVGTNLASALQQAISESFSDTGLTANSMKQLQAQFEGLGDGDFSEIFYNTANGVKLDMLAVQKLVKAQQGLVTGDLTRRIKSQNSQLSQLKTQYKNAADAAEKMKIASQIDASESGLENLYNQLAQYQAQYAQAMKEFTKLADFQRAQSSANAGDNYKTLQGYLETAEKAWETGEIGTDDFKTYAAMYDEWGRTSVEAYTKNRDKIKRYVTEDATGVANFYDDLVKAGYGTFDASTNEYALDVSNIEEAAHALGIGSEFAEYVFGRAEDFGFYNDFVKDQIDGELKLMETEHDLAEAIAHKYDLMRQGAPQDVIDEANAEIERLDQRVVNLRENTNDVITSASTITSEQIQSAVDVLGEYKKHLDSAQSDSERNTWQKAIKDFAEQNHIPITFDYDVDTAKLDEMFAGWDERTPKLKLGIDSSTLSEAGYAEGQFSKQYSHGGQTVVMTPVLPDGTVMDANSFGSYVQNVARNGVEQNTEGLFMRVFDGENAQEEARAYGSVLDTVSTKLSQNEGLAEQLTSQFGDYTFEQLSAIDYADGKLDASSAQAEQAVDAVMRSLGLSSEQAQQFIQVLSDMGVVASQVAGKEYNISLGVETGQLEGFLTGTRYEGITSFDAMSMSADELQQKLKELSSHSFVAHVETEGGEEAKKQLDELTQATEKEYNIKIGLETMGRGGRTPEEFLGWTRGQQEAYMMSIGVDSSNYDAFIQRVQSQKIEAKVTTYLDKDGQKSIEELEQMYERNPVEFAAEVDCDPKEAEQTLEELKAQANREEASIKIKIEDEQFNNLLSSISGSQNQTPINIAINTAAAVQSLAAITASLTVLRLQALAPINITVKTESSVEQVNNLKDAINELEDKRVNVGANVTGRSSVDNLRRAIDMLSGKSVYISVLMGNALSQVDNLRRQINQLTGKTITITTIHTTINRSSSSSGSVEKGGSKRGTMATGTLHGLASGTMNAYASGKKDVAIDKDQYALVNEVGIESRVRQGEWSLIPGGPHVEKLKKGDKIFVPVYGDIHYRTYLTAEKPLESYKPQRSHEIQASVMV